MGHSYASVRIHNKKLSKSKEMSLLVGSGSVYTWIRGSTLKDLEVVQESKRKFKTTEGRTVERKPGEVVVEYNGLRTTTIVVFGLEKDAEVLGVHALEGLRLEIDPVTEKLRKVEAILAI